jgi:hypothetical protein
MNRLDHAEPNRTPELPSWLFLVRKAAATLQFGDILIKIHNGKIVQIETNQKLRLDDIQSETQLPPTAQAEAQPTKLIKIKSHRNAGGFAKS